MDQTLQQERRWNALSQKALNEGGGHARITDNVRKKFFLIFGEQFVIGRVNSIELKMKILDIFILIFAYTGGLVGVIASEYNVDFIYTDPADTKNLSKMKVQLTTDESVKNLVFNCRVLNSVLTGLILILLFVHYKLLLSLNKLKLLCNPDDGLFGSGMWKYLLLEWLLNVCHSPPGYNFSVSVSQRSSAKPTAEVYLDNILTIIQLFFRAYHIIFFIAYHSKFRRYECEKICLECNATMDFLFAVKAEFKRSPFLLVGSVMIISIFVFGYSVRSIEMFFMYGAENKAQDWRYFWNGFWCVIITMTTVGFGDFYPISVLGRAIIVISSFWGTFLISLMVAALTVAVEFNPQEASAYDTFKAAHAEIEYGKVATILFQTLIRYNNHINKLKSDWDLTNSNEWQKGKSVLFSKLKNVLEIFRRLKKNKSEKAKSLLIEYSIHKIDENLTLEMEKIKSQIKVVDDIQIMLTEYSQNQNLLKNKCLELYKELEEMSLLKENYLKLK